MILLVSFIGSIFATAVFRWVALRSGFLDVPNHRSAHTIATPHGGGVAFSFVSVTLVLLASWSGLLLHREVLAFVPGAVAIALIGLLDDFASVAVRVRLAVHVSVAISVIVLLGGGLTVKVGVFDVDLGVLTDIVFVVAIVWSVNLFNFMDGIDGIASVQAVSVLLGMLIIGGVLPTAGLPLLIAILIASVAGFLVLNWPPAKIFMGDAGSGFLGFALICVGLLAHQQGYVSFWSWLILNGLFIVDATYTLGYRVVHGYRWYEAHNGHAYQYLARELGGYRLVIGLQIAANVFWLLPLAWWANQSDDHAYLIAIVAWSAILVTIVKLKVGRLDMASRCRKHC
ncbi:MAG: glycosyltransferase family 4 protein [Pseudomonadota bacterium]